MKLLDFINTHENWKELLVAEPYYLNISSDVIGDKEYYICKYNMIMSDFALPEVREARGCIFRWDEINNTWICVCHPFDKFFNYGEQYSAVNNIDWETASVQQKVDGSLIKMWYDFGWHISTNGTIDAAKAECGTTTYLALVETAIHSIPNFWDSLDTRYTYMFELTSPFNHIVIKYKGVRLWYLGRRNIINDEEDSETLNLNGIARPRYYPHQSLAECIAAAHEMGDDEEGYVVCDNNFNRIKIKGDEYLKLHKLRGNGPVTVARVIDMWKEETLDDFLAYYPEFKNFSNQIIKVIERYISISDLAFKTVSSMVGNSDRAKFAEQAKTYVPIIKSYLFTRLDNKVENAFEFYFKMHTHKLVNAIVAEIPKLRMGVTEDE